MVTHRGGENVLEQICRLYPKSEIATLISNQSCRESTTHGSNPVVDSLLRYLPRAEKLYKYAFPVYPYLLKKLDYSQQGKLRFIIDANVMKGMARNGAVPSICYCLSPPRYLWDKEIQSHYWKDLSAGSFINRFFLKVFERYLKSYDYESAQSVTEFVAISKFIQDRIKKYYNRDSTVIYPPVDLSDISVSQRAEDFYLIVSHLVPYKNVDLAIQSFNQNGKKLIIIGEGGELEKLQKMASPNILFKQKQSRKEVVWHLENCKAFVHPQVEDFGIAACEAQAAGKPVIAYRKGGALETVVDGKTGIFFDYETVESLNQALCQLEKLEICRSLCRENVERFSNERFVSEIQSLVGRYLVKHRIPEHLLA